jgi:NAD(P)-dependent dehydrogenase (short-subunit alcohol dehydrogenase family)
MGTKLQGRAALVIGGSSGVGRASAEACAAEGAKVMIADVNTACAEEAIATIKAAGGTASFIHTDGTSDPAVKAAVEATVREFGSLDILINSAGGSNPHSDEGWHLAIDMFLKGPYYACKYALPEMEKRGGGSIINIGSLSSVTGSMAQTIEATGYPCAKHGLLGLTRTLALSCASKNIRVNALCPGYIKTGLTRKMYEAEDGGRKLISETLRVPMERWGEPEEIGKVAAFLASDDASYITGQPIIVDGGFMAR